MHSQPTSTQFPSPASVLPYDILREIFLHCFPHFPLDEIQPNIKIMPMLLCQVCSSWRTVALDIPSLWSYISCRLPIRWEDGQPIAWDSKLFLHSMEFLTWWRENQSTIAPHIRFDFYQRENNSIYKEVPLTNDNIKFFVEYLSSARHLDVGEFYGYLFSQDGTRRTQVDCPRLHSLVTRYPNISGEEDEHADWSRDEGDEYLARDDNGGYSASDYEEDDESILNEEENEARSSSDEEDDEPILSEEEFDEANVIEKDEYQRSTDGDNDYMPRPKPILVPFHIPSTLRRLGLHDAEFKLSATNMDAFTSWSSLTHLSLQGVFMLPDVWYALIRGLPNLQWGYFDIFLQLPREDSDPPMFTLPFLSTLSVNLDNSEGNGYPDPLGQFFENLHLPALSDLAIYIDSDPYYLPDAASMINNVLKSAPAVTKLTLGPQFLGFHPWNSKPNWKHVEKLSMLAPHLKHIIFDTCYVRPEFTKPTLPKRLRYWKKLLRPSHWLDLTSPASSVRKVTAIVKTLSEDGPIVEACIRGALKLDKEGRSKGADDLVFEIVEEDEGGALSPNGMGWRTWGRSL